MAMAIWLKLVLNRLACKCLLVVHVELRYVLPQELTQAKGIKHAARDNLPLNPSLRHELILKYL